MSWRDRFQRLPLLGRFLGESEPPVARPHGYDLIGELEHDLDPEQLPPAKQQAAHAALLESLRALRASVDVPTVVIAAVDKAESARPVIAGLIIQAHLRGLRLSLGKLVPGQGYRLLRKRLPRGHGDDGTRPPRVGDDDDLALRIVGAPDSEQLRRWYEMAAADRDLLIIEAPPLLSSVDAALLGRACDGLVLVSESMLTRQEDLETALERARAAGCPPLGLIMDRHREWLPRMVRKILPGYPRSIRRDAQGAER
ncbi:MAG: hypothetical protein AAGF23_12255 [Acidobacteriota bacterium]